MRPSLKYPKLKVERAKEHLEVLDVKFREFTSSKPFSVTTEEDVNQGLYFVRMEIPIIDPTLAIIASDAVYNLRSALDHIAWQLALTTKDRPFDRTEFPIIDIDTPENMRRFKRITRDIPIEAINEIKALQPYLRGTAYKTDFLWLCDKLCNIDKHRVIPAEGTVLDLKFPKGIPMKGFTLDNAYIVIMPLIAKTQMQFAPPPTLDIIFGSVVDGAAISIKDLPKIYEFVRDSVLPRFMRFFPE